MLLIVFLFATLATIVSAWMLTAPWLHVRVEEEDGKRVAISLPLPLTLANWGVQFAGRFVDDETASYMSASSEFLKAMRRERKQDAEPIVIDVDEDGHRVRVYIG